MRCGRVECSLRKASGGAQCLRLESEADLHAQVVKFIDETYGSLPIPLTSESGAQQTTPEARRLAHERGYCRGDADLTINVASGGYSALVLEFKRPNQGGAAQPSEAQARMHEILRWHGRRVLTSSSYEEIVLEIKRYLEGARLFRCSCGKGFTSERHLDLHLRASRAVALRRPQSA